jgi:hypothetical protein
VGRGLEREQEGRRERTWRNESENALKRKRNTLSGLDEDGYEYLLTKLHGVACYKILALI